MMWSDLAAAVALLVVIEGAIPFISPAHSKRMSRIVSEMSESHMRLGGFISMLLGLALLFWVRS